MQPLSKNQTMKEKYLGGKILTAIYCETCGKYYHLNCFELDDDGEEKKQPNEPKTSNDYLKKLLALYFVYFFLHFHFVQCTEEKIVDNLI
mgnify:CR=1 FL=1